MTRTLVDTDARRCCYDGVSKDELHAAIPQIQTALCVDGGAFGRFGRILRHLAVGLVDQAIHLCLISADPRVEALSLGPVQTLLRPILRWPAGKKRLASLIEMVSAQPPGIVHALSYDSYEVAFELADSMDADLVLQVTSLADCEELADFDASRVGRFLVASPALIKALETQGGVDAQRMVLVRPGILVADKPACFVREDRSVTVVCTSPFEREYGVDLLIEAIAELRGRGVSLIVFLLGQGSLEPMLRRLARGRNLSACTVFARPLGDYDQALYSADIMVRPSADTAFTVDTLEAMSAGLVVVTFAGDVCDYIRADETAVVCSNHTPKAIADAIEALVQDRDFARKIATSAMAYVRTYHGISAMAAHTASAYRELAVRRTTFSIRK
jgi:glycosyltransferase involved in cell wall biosynthesis